jgi:Kef-type K+ transport system membrane component KefB
MGKARLLPLPPFCVGRHHSSFISIHFFVVLVAILGLFQWLVPKITLWLKTINKNQKGYEGDIRVVFLILIGAVVLFQIIGLHPTIAAFFVGMMLADCHISERLRAKLHVLAYGFFIPLFFFITSILERLSNNYY